MIAELDPPEPDALHTVSIIIPTHNRAASLGVTLNALNDLLVPDEVILQVVTVLDGCTDNSLEVFKSWQSNFKHLTVAISTDGLGAGGARNIGLASATGHLIGFIDDDVIPNPLWLERHLRCHIRTSEPVVTVGAMSLPLDKRLPPWNEWEVRSLRQRYYELESGNAHAEPADLYTANAMIPRNALEKVGGFDASLRRAEDVDLGLRLAEAGLTFQFLADANVAHYPIRTLQNWKKIPVAYAYSHFEMQTSHVSKGMTQLGSPQLGKMHPVTKIAVRMFARKQITSTIYCAFAQTLGSLAYFARLRSVSYAAFSSIYNVLYFGTLYRIQVQHEQHDLTVSG